MTSARISPDNHFPASRSIVFQDHDQESRGSSQKCVCFPSPLHTTHFFSRVLQEFYKGVSSALQMCSKFLLDCQLF